MKNFELLNDMAILPKTLKDVTIAVEPTKLGIYVYLTNYILVVYGFERKEPINVVKVLSVIIPLLFFSNLFFLLQL